MSFYQPSLSLFDVLNALSDHAAPRNPQLRHGGPHRRTYAHGSQNAAHTGVNPFHGPYSMARNDFFDPFAAGGPVNVYYDDGDDNGYPGATYLYRHPYGPYGGNNSDYYYYSPQFNRDDEDEEEGPQHEEEEDVEEDDDDEKMGEDDSGAAKGIENPSYYHTRNGNNRFGMMYPQSGYQRRNQSRDYLNDLLDTFFGTARDRGEQVPGKQEDKDVKNPSDEEQVEDNTTQERNADNTTTLDKSEGKQEKSDEDTGNSTTSKPGLKKKNSNAFMSGPSIVTPTLTKNSDPLKVSKPETRMDLPFTPEVNVYDLKTEYIVVLALPGSNSKAFKVDYHPTTHELIVRGNVTDKLGVDEKYLKLSEIKYGAFERTIKFPILPRIKDEEIKAKYSNGLLQINVPKMDGSQDKPIPKKRITIEEIPDAELEFEKNPNPVEKI